MDSLSKSVMQYLKKKLRPLIGKLATHFDYIIAPRNYANNFARTYIHGESEFERVLPVHVDVLHKNFLKGAPGITNSSEKTFIRVLEKAKVFSGQGFVINDNNEICTELNFEDNRNIFLINNVFFQKPLFINGISLLISGKDASSNYFHWMTDAIPKLSIAQLAGYNFQQVNKIIVSNDNLNFQKETLLHLNFQKENVISLTENNYLICEKLIAPSATCLSGNVSSWIVDYLRTLFQDWMEIDSSLPKKIYIGRKKNGKRVLLNEDELTVILKAEGFEIVFPEDLSLKGQIQLFYNAAEIIGVHGAGLTNLIFSRQGTNVTELFPVTYVNQCYWTIASHNKLKYSYLTGEGKDTTDEFNHLIDTDFYISAEKLMCLRQKI